MSDFKFELPDGKICLNLTETAEVLGISRPIAEKLVRTETFPKVKIGRRFLVPVIDLAAWCSKNIGGEIDLG